MSNVHEQLSGTHFMAREFRCRCGCGLGLESMQLPFLRRLIAARSVSPVPFVINSSIRCADYNAAQGGVQNSAHLSGWAVDISASNSRHRYQILVAAQQAGFQRIGVGEQFLHLDCDPEKPDRVIWTY